MNILIAANEDIAHFNYNKYCFREKDQIAGYMATFLLGHKYESDYFNFLTKTIIVFNQTTNLGLKNTLLGTALCSVPSENGFCKQTLGLFERLNNQIHQNLSNIFCT